MRWEEYRKPERCFFSYLEDGDNLVQAAVGNLGGHGDGHQQGQFHPEADICTVVADLELVELLCLAVHHAHAGVNIFNYSPIFHWVKVPYFPEFS